MGVMQEQSLMIGRMQALAADVIAHPYLYIERKLIPANFIEDDEDRSTSLYRAVLAMCDHIVNGRFREARQAINVFTLSKGALANLKQSLETIAR